MTIDVLLTNMFPQSWTVFLNTVIYSGAFVYLNYWSIIHLAFGVGAYYIWPKDNFKLFLGLVILFEFVEYILGIGGSTLFGETVADTAWDFIMTLGGFLVTRALDKKMREPKAQG